MRHIKIVKTKENKVASLEIDGKPAKTDVLERLQFVGVELPSDELPTVTLKYRPSEVDIEIELEELPATEAKTFMGFELVDIPLTSEIIEHGKVNGSEAHYVLRLLYDNNLIKHMGDKKQAYALLHGLNVPRQFLHEDFHGNKVIKSDEDWGWDL